MSDERQHCEAVAATLTLTMGDAPQHDKSQRQFRRTIADLLMAERAGLLARAEAAEAERDEERRVKGEYLAAHVEDIEAWSKSRANLRAKLAAAEARVAELEAHGDRLRQDRADALSVKSREGLLASEWVARTGKAERERDKAEAAAGQMRDEMHLCLNPTRVRTGVQDPCPCCVRGWVTLSNTDAGRGYLSPEQVAQEREVARRSALEEAARAQCYRCASGKSHLAAMTDGSWEHHYDGDVVAVCSAGPVHTLKAVGGGS